MKVKLISATQNPIDLMWTAARTCYSEKSPIDIWTEDRFPNLEENDAQREFRLWNLVKTVLDSGHESIAEIVNFTFAIEGVSRVLLAQITRHRTGVVFQVQSQRYVEFKESYDTLTEAFDKGTEQQEEYLKTIANKYFTEITNDNYRDYIQALINYLGVIKRGIKAEDARMILPNATKTNIVMTVNLRQLMHMCNLRLCTRAQAEIRNLFKLIKIEVEAYDKKLNSLLVPTCFKLGYCPEHNSCKQKPTKQEVFEYYERYKNLNDE